MKRRSPTIAVTALFAILGIISLATVLGTTASNSTPSYKADLRPIRFAVAGGAQWKPDTAVTYLRKQMAGADRVILKIRPMHKHDGGEYRSTLSSAAWHGLQIWERQAIVLAVQKHMRGGGTVELYIGGRIANPHRLSMIDAVPPNDDRGRWLQSVLPWVFDVGVTPRIWIDASSRNPRSTIELAQWANEHFGITVGMEAYPRKESGDLDFSTMAKVPVIATDNYWISRARKSWRVPAGYEAVFLLKQHEWPISRIPELRDKIDRGFILAATDKDWNVLKAAYGSAFDQGKRSK